MPHSKKQSVKLEAVVSQPVVSGDPPRSSLPMKGLRVRKPFSLPVRPQSGAATSILFRDLLSAFNTAEVGKSAHGTPPVSFPDGFGGRNEVSKKVVDHDPLGIPLSQNETSPCRSSRKWAPYSSSSRRWAIRAVVGHGPFESAGRAAPRSRTC